MDFFERLDRRPRHAWRRRRLSAARPLPLVRAGNGAWTTKPPKTTDSGDRLSKQRRQAPPLCGLNATTPKSNRAIRSPPLMMMLHGDAKTAEARAAAAAGDGGVGGGGGDDDGGGVCINISQRLQSTMDESLRHLRPSVKNRSRSGRHGPLPVGGGIG